MSCDTGNATCCLIDALCENINELVTIYTEGGCCFTGLLVSVCPDAVKLVTNSCSRCGGNNFGKITIIPIRQIVAVTLCNTSS